MQQRRLVFVDLESVGLDPQGPIRQLAAVAVDARLREVAAFEAKIRVDWRQLRRWQRDHRRTRPKPNCGAERDVAHRFAEFLKTHAGAKHSATGTPTHQAAQLVAHNASHDGPFLQAFLARHHFYPGSWRMLCTLQHALWFFHEHRTLPPPADFKLATLCRYFNVPFHAADAHDALGDARATFALYRALVGFRVRAKWSRKMSWRYSSNAGPPPARVLK